MLIPGRASFVMCLLAMLVPAAASAVELRNAEVVSGGQPVLQNAGGTVRLENARLGRLGPVAYLPEPGVLGQVGPGVGLLALLRRHRRSPSDCTREEDL